MTDSLTTKEQPDRSKINMNQSHEVRYWTKHLNISKEDIARHLNLPLDELEGLIWNLTGPDTRPAVQDKKLRTIQKRVVQKHGENDGESSAQAQDCEWNDAGNPTGAMATLFDSVAKTTVYFDRKVRQQELALGVARQIATTQISCAINQVYGECCEDHGGG